MLCCASDTTGEPPVIVADPVTAGEPPVIVADPVTTGEPPVIVADPVTIGGLPLTTGAITVTAVTTSPGVPQITAQAGCGVVAVEATPRASALTRVTRRAPRSVRNAVAMPGPPCPDPGSIPPVTNPSASIVQALVAILVSS